MKTEKQTISFTPYQKLLVAILAFLNFTVILDFMVLSPLGDILMKSMGISTKQFGAVVSAYAFSAGISGILAAGFADKFDRKKLLLFFYTGFVIGTLCCATANSYTTLLIARIVTGLFGGVIGSIGMAIVTDTFELQQRGRVMGITQMAFAASQVLGIPIGIIFANNWGWHSSFFMIVAISILVGLVIVFRMKPVDKHLALQSDKSAFLHLWHTVAKKDYRIGFVATACLSIGGFMMMPFGSAFLINNIQIDPHQLPIVFMLTGIASIIIMPLVGKLADKIDKFHLFTGGSILAIIMIIFYTHLSVTPLWEVVLVNMVLFMGIMSRMIPATILNTSIPDMQDRGAFMSINASLQQMAGGIAAICAGFVVVQTTKTSPLEHYDTLGYVVSAVIIVGIFLVYRVSEMVKQKLAKRELDSINNAIAQRNEQSAIEETVKVIMES